MNKMLEIIEAQKLFNLPIHKLEILIHPDSLIHAIVQFKNGLTKIIFHETSMLIPLANAIFNNKIDIDIFLIKKRVNNLKFLKILFLKQLITKFFQSLKLKKN